jgi:hypothetical protein
MGASTAIRERARIRVDVMCIRHGFAPFSQSEEHRNKWEMVTNELFVVHV